MGNSTNFYIVYQGLKKLDKKQSKAKKKIVVNGLVKHPLKYDR